MACNLRQTGKIEATVIPVLSTEKGKKRSGECKRTIVFRIETIKREQKMQEDFLVAKVET